MKHALLSCPSLPTEGVLALASLFTDGESLERRIEVMRSSIMEVAYAGDRDEQTKAVTRQLAILDAARARCGHPGPLEKIQIR